MSRRSDCALVKKHARAAGIKADLSPHKIRRSFAIHLLEGGDDLRSLAASRATQATPTQERLYDVVVD